MHWLIVLSLATPLINFTLKLKGQENVKKGEKKSKKTVFTLKYASLSNLSHAMFEAGCKHQIMLSLSHSNAMWKILPEVMYYNVTCYMWEILKESNLLIKQKKKKR